MNNNASMPEIMLTDWFYWLCIAIYSATIISIIYIILKENRNPVRSLAWITVLFFLPVAGLVLYLFFGRSIKNKALISKRLKKRFAHSRPIKQADIANCHSRRKAVSKSAWGISCRVRFIS